MAPRKRFTPVDLYKDPVFGKPLSVKAPKTRRTSATTPQLSTIGHLFDKAAGPLADYIKGERDRDDRANMQKALMAFRSGLPGQKEYVTDKNYSDMSPEERRLAQQGVREKYAEPAYEAVIGGPMDQDETDQDNENMALDAYYNAMPDKDDRGHFTQGKSLEGVEAAIAAAGPKPGPVTQRMLNTLLLSDTGLGLGVSGKNTPSNIAEWRVYQNMSPKDQEKYLNMKRASKWLNLGGSFTRPSQASPGQDTASRAVTLKPSETPEHAGRVEGTKKAAALAMKIAGEAWESLGKVNKNIGNINDAIAAIDDGANTGPIYKMLPSISAASVELDNIQNRMGLDVIGTVTFGALSKGELDLALSTALPTGLKPPELRKWLVEKRSAQAKLSKYLTSAAIYLGKPGNTVSKWAEKQKTKAKVPAVTSSPTPEVKPKYTREEILEELKKRGLKK